MNKQPDRQVAVVGAFQRHGEFGIGEGEIDDGAQPLALNLLGDEMKDQLDRGEHNHPDPEHLAADAAMESVEEIRPIDRCHG